MPPRTLDAAVTLLAPVAEALAISHARGVSHLDVRPGTLLVLYDGRSGGCSARLLAAAASIDAPRSAAYLAPEQRCAAYGIAGPWTDVFALARVLVELVMTRAGVRTTEGQGAVLARALSVYPALRHPTAASFWQALARVRTSTPPALWRTGQAGIHGTSVATSHTRSPR
ncbi:MAG: hypothetical protein ACREJ3_15920 [Polyangiaceae bacterium]